MRTVETAIQAGSDLIMLELHVHLCDHEETSTVYISHWCRLTVSDGAGNSFGVRKLRPTSGCVRGKSLIMRDWLCGVCSAREGHRAVISHARLPRSVKPPA